LRKVVFFLIISVLLLTSVPAIASTTAGKSEFTDLDENHWAYESVKNIVKSGIMSKDSKGRFNPNGTVSRGEFAVLIVKALELPLKNPDQATFLDIPKNSQYYKYVETAKYYLTGYRTSQGDYFRPDELSVREDIAVSLVKALGYQPINNYAAILDNYRDVDKVSPNLRSFVASVVDNEVMIGSGAGNNMMFNPQLILTRAEMAKLLNNILTMEKVTYDEGDKVTYSEDEVTPAPTASPTPTPIPDEASFTPQISIKTISDGLKVEWDKTQNGNFNYYKVVMSKSNSNPAYPDDGYVAYISDINKTYFVITPGQNYNGGDFSKVASGQKYYINVTAVYNHGKYTGNAIYKEMP